MEGNLMAWMCSGFFPQPNPSPAEKSDQKTSSETFINKCAAMYNSINQKESENESQGEENRKIVMQLES